MRIFFGSQLETAATWWRIYRSDGATLGFTTHDRDLLFDGVVHRAAPGMLPSAIRTTSDLADEASEVEGLLGHGDITERELAAGRFDNARIASGVVDWETLEAATLYAGVIGAVSRAGTAFRAEMRSVKADLARDPVPLTSPTCRARFCGPGCDLSAVVFERRSTVIAADHASGRILVDVASTAPYRDGELRWLDGPHAGQRMQVLDETGSTLLLDRAVSEEVRPGTGIELREGCDHTIATCRSRFGNAINFRGEPYLPGNDAMARYPVRR